MSANPRCVICHQAATTWSACSRCERRLDDQLDELADLFAFLSASRDAYLLGFNEATQNQRGRRVDPPAPLSLEVADLLDPRCGPTAMLAAWASDIRDRYGLATESHRTNANGLNPHPGPLTPAIPRTEPLGALVAFLRAQLPRMCETHPAVDDFANEVRVALTELDVAVRGDRPRRVNLGECPVVLPADDHEPARACRRTIWHDPVRSVIHCLACGSAWAEDQWPHLAALIAS